MKLALPDHRSSRCADIFVSSSLVFSLVQSDVIICVQKAFRYAVLLAGLTLLFVLSASVDQVRDDPGTVTHRSTERSGSIQIKPELNPGPGISLAYCARDCSRAAILWTCRLVFQYRTTFDSGVTLRRAADSSPPVVRS